MVWRQSEMKVAVWERRSSRGIMLTMYFTVSTEPPGWRTRSNSTRIGVEYSGVA